MITVTPAIKDKPMFSFATYLASLLKDHMQKVVNSARHAHAIDHFGFEMQGFEVLPYACVHADGRLELFAAIPRVDGHVPLIFALERTGFVVSELRERDVQWASEKTTCWAASVTGHGCEFQLTYETTRRPKLDGAGD